MIPVQYSFTQLRSSPKRVELVGRLGDSHSTHPQRMIFSLKPLQEDREVFPTLWINVHADDAILPPDMVADFLFEPQFRIYVRGKYASEDLEEYRGVVQAEKVRFVHNSQSLEEYFQTIKEQ